MDDNPWQVDTIEDFLYYKCPECSFEVRKQQVFQEHAIENHPLSYVFFGKKDEEEEFHDPLKIEDVTSNALVVQYEKLPNKKEIRFKTICKKPKDQKILMPTLLYVMNQNLIQKQKLTKVIRRILLISFKKKKNSMTP